MAKSFSMGAILGVAMKLITLDASARVVQAIPGLDSRVQSLVSISIALARFPILKKLTKGLPFGVSAIINGLMTISAIQIVVAALPGLIGSFGTATAGGPPGGPPKAPLPKAPSYQQQYGTAFRR